MKNLFKPSIIIILLFSGYCQKQKIITNIGDAKKIEINQSKFVGKPLKYLLAQIGPKIKSAIGNPDDDSKNRTKLIQLYFVDKEEFLTRNNKNDTPTSISVVFSTR